MATQGVVVSIQAKIEGWQDQIKAIQSAMKNMSVDSGLGKGIAKDLASIVPMVNKLGQHVNQRLTSDMDISNFTNQIKEVERLFGQVGKSMSQMSFEDLDLDWVKDNFKDIVKSIEEAQNALDKGLQSSFQDVISQSTKMQHVFNTLKISPENMNIDQVREALTGEAEKFKSELDAIGIKATEINEKLAQAREKKNSLEKHSPVNIKNIDQKASEIIGDSSSFGVEKILNTSKVRELAATLGNDLATAKASVKAQSTEINTALQNIATAETLDQVRTNINRLREIFSDTGASQKLFGDLSNIEKNMESFTLDPEAFANKIASMRQAMAKDGLTEAEINKIMTNLETLMKSGKWDQLSTTLANYIKEAKAQSLTELKATNKEIQDLMDERSKIVTKPRGQNQARLDAANLGLKELENIDKIIHEQTKNLSDELTKSQELLQAKSLQGLKGLGGHLQNSAVAGLQAANKEMMAYSQNLARVQSTEQMISKAQGFVQRWFSIYTVMRMARKAFKEVTSTIKELDTTMTDIAIATNMTQADLWKQVPQYTAMAQKYAASIQGVYEVSKLYYQQGLQSGDVNALTEATLKMARVSGLDYAESADYMTNAIRSFKMEMTDANHIVDVYSAVAASSASNAKELATAMSKTAASAQAVGSTFENTTAMLAVMIEATRESPENIGSAMKSIISRYGELKENKTGIDEEGEAYSLNKVDTALQSVGIKIHDVNGEFRNFDEVVMELSDRWDAIDKNTQRYIATTMAGNRQQSRFLSLVSSATRLREEADKAANSEDASQIQFLKSLESVDGKVQQLKTSLQSLYINAGLEETYKGLIDFGTNVANTLSNLGSEAGLGAIIGKIGATFVTMATLVTTAFNTIKTRFKVMESTMTADAQLESARREGIAANEAVERAQKIGGQDLVDAHRRQEEAMTANQQAQANKRLALAEKEAALRMKLRSSLGMIASTAGMIATTAAANMDLDTQRNQKSLLTGIGGALSGIGTGLMIGNWAGAIVGTLTAIPSIVEAIGMSTESVSEKVIRLQNNVEEANNENIKAKDDLQTLANYKKKWDELSKSQFESTEAQKKFKDLQNEIANKYPELISSMQDEGNAIVDMTSAYESLRDAKLETYNNAFFKNLGTELAALKDIDYVLSSIYSMSPQKDNTILAGTIHTNDRSKYSQLFQASFNSPQTNGEITGPNDRKWYGDYGYQILSTSSGHGANNLSDIFNIPNADFHYIGGYEGQYTFTEKLLESDLGKSYLGYLYGTYENAVKNNIPYEDIQLQKDEYLKNAIFQSMAYNSDMNKVNIPELQELLYPAQMSRENYERMVKTYSADKYASEAQSRLIRAQVESYINTIGQSVDLDFDTNALQKFAVANQVSSELETWYNENKNKINKKDEYAYIDENGELQAYDVPHLLEAFFKGGIMDSTGLNTAVEGGSLNPANYADALKEYGYLNDSLNSLYNNLGTIAHAQLGSKIRDLGFEGDEFTTIFGIFEAAYEQNYKGIVDRYENWASALSQGENAQTSKEISDTIKSFGQKIGPEYLVGIQDQYKNILNNTSLDSQQMDAQLNGLNNVIDSFMGENTGFTNNQQQTILQKMQTADLTSLFGIYSLFDTLTDAGLDIGDADVAGTFKNQLTAFSKLLKINIPAELDAYTTSLATAAQGFEKDLSSATSGMDAKSAAELASKLDTTVSDEAFSIRDGKFYFNDLDRIQEEYTKQRSAYETALTEAIGEQSEGLAGITNVSEQSINNKQALSQLESKASNQNFVKDFQKKTGMDYNAFLDYYKDYVKSGDEFTNFSEFLQAQVSEETANVTAWLGQQTAINKLKSQGFESFYNEVVSQTDALEAADPAQMSALLDAAMSQDFSELETSMPEVYEAFKPYFGTLISTFKETKQSVLNSLVNVMGTGKGAGITISAANLPYLKELGLVDENAKDEELIGQKLQTIVDNVNGLKEKVRDEILSTVTSEQEQISMFQQMHENEFKQNKLENLKNITDGQITYKEFTDYLSQNRKFSAEQIFGENSVLEREAAAYGLAMDASGNYYVQNWAQHISQLQSDLDWMLTHQDEGTSVEEINAARAAVEAAQKGRDQSIVKASEDVIKNYEDISTTQKEALANAFQQDSALLEGFYYEEGGKTKLNIGALRTAIANGVDGLTEGSQSLLLSLFSNIADDAMSAIDDIMSYTTQGTKKQSDIQKVVDQFKDKGKDYTGDQLFKYDDMLDAYMFQSEYLAEYLDIQAQTYADAMGISQPQALAQIKKQTQKTAAAAVDIQGYLNAERQGAGSQAYEKLSRQLMAYEEAKNDYLSEDAQYWADQGSETPYDEVAKAQEHNAQLREEAKDRAKADLKALTGGGQEAVDKAKEIAERAGIELSAQDIQDTYAPYAKKLSDFGQQMAELSVGQFVDVTSDFGAKMLSMGLVDKNGIVQNLEHISEAYRQLYEELGKDSSNATVAQINAAASQYLISKNKKYTNAIEGLAGGASMTADALVNMYDQAGIAFGEYQRYNGSMLESYVDADRKIEELVQSGALIDLEGGQYQIGDINQLAKDLHWDVNSQQFQKAYSELIDAIISENANLDPIKRGTKQLQALASANIGDTLQVKDIPDEIKEKMGIADQETLTIVSEAQRDALLAAIDQQLIDNANDPALKAQLESLRNTINAGYMTQATKAASLGTSGTTSLEDMASFQQAFNDLTGITKTIDELFDYNAITKNWTLKAQYMNEMIVAQAQSLVESQQLAEEDVNQWKADQLKANTIDKIDFKSALSAGATPKSRAEMKQSIEDYYTGQVETWNTDFGQVTQEITQTTGLTGELAKGAARVLIWAREQTNAELIEQAKADAADIYDQLLKGGQTGMNALKQIKKDASSEELQAAYDATIAPIRSVLDIVGDLQAGTVVQADQIESLRAAGFTVQDDGLVTATKDLVTAYASLYQQIKNHAQANTLEINDAYAKYLTATEQGDIDAIAAMGDAMGMTYETLGQLLGKSGTDLETWMQANQNLYESIGAGKIRISDFAGFAKERGWEPGSEEYTSAFKTYNDSMIELNKNQKDAIKNELSQFSEAKAGDQLNLTDTWAQLTQRVSNAQAEYIAARGISSENDARQYQALTNQTNKYNEELQARQDQFVNELADAGVVFDKGIATLGENVNWAGVAQAYKDYYSSMELTIDSETASWLDVLSHRSQQELGSAYNDMLSNWQAITPEMINAFVQAGGAATYEEAKQLLGLKDQGDGTYKLSISDLQKAMKFADIADITREAITKQLAEIADNALQNISTASSLVTQGTTSKADMQKFITSAQQLGVETENAFSYDSILNAWTLNATTMGKYVAAQSQQLVEEGLLSPEEVTNYVNKNVIQALAGAVDIKSYLESENRDGQARQKLAQQLLNAKFINQQTQQELTAYEVGMIISTLEEGGAAAVDIMQQIATMAGQELTSADIETAYRAQVSRIEKASEQLTSGIGAIVDGETIDILENANYDLAKMDGTNSAVITSIGDISLAYANYYNKLKDSNVATLEQLNNAYAKVLETEDGRNKEQSAIEALGDAAGMTFETLGAIFSEAGMNLEENMNILKESGMIEAIGGNKVRIKDFTAFASAMNWNFSSEEYISAFKSYNDSLIELNRKTEKTILDEVKSVEGANIGDQLNLTQFMDSYFNALAPQKYLEDAASALAVTQGSSRAQELANKMMTAADEFSDPIFNSLKAALSAAGATLSEGILTFSEEADKFEVLSILDNAITEMEEANSDLDFGDVHAQIKDSLNNITKSYFDAISSGMAGNLSYQDAEKLSQYAKAQGGKQLDFKETAEGLQLTEDSFFSLYGILKKTNKLMAKKLLPDMSKISGKYKNLGEAMEEYAKALKAGNTDKADALRELLDDMLASPDSYKLMDYDMPPTWQSSDNFYQSARQAYDVTQAMKSGTVGMSDFVAFAQSLIHSGDNAAKQAGLELLQQGADTVGIDENGNSIVDTKLLASLLGVKNINKWADGYYDTWKSAAEKIQNAGVNQQKAYNALYFGSEYLESADIYDENGDVSGEKIKTLIDQQDSQGKSIEALLSKINVNNRNLADVVKNGKTLKKDEQAIIKTLMNTDWENGHIEEQLMDAFGNKKGKVVFKEDGEFTIDFGGSDDFSIRYEIDGQEVNASDYGRLVGLKAREGFKDISGNIGKDERAAGAKKRYQFTVGGMTAEVTINADSTVKYKLGGQEYSGEQYDAITQALSQKGAEVIDNIEAAGVKDQKSNTKAVSYTVGKVKITTYIDMQNNVRYLGQFTDGNGEAHTIKGDNQQDVLNMMAALGDKDAQETITGLPHEERTIEVDGTQYTIIVDNGETKIQLKNPTADGSTSDNVTQAFTDWTNSAGKGQTIEVPSDTPVEATVSNVTFKIAEGSTPTVDLGSTEEGPITIPSDQEVIIELSKVSYKTTNEATAPEGPTENVSSEGITVPVTPVIEGSIDASSIPVEGTAKIPIQADGVEQAQSDINAISPPSTLKVKVEADETAILAMEKRFNKIVAPSIDVQVNVNAEGVSDAIGEISVEPVEITYEAGEAPEPPEAKPGEGLINYVIDQVEKLPPQTATGTINWLNEYTTPTGLTATGTIYWKNAGGCFIAGTQIIMSNYKMKNIEDIKVGEQVLAYNDELEQFEVHTVTKSYEHHDTPRVLEMTLSNGVILGITPGHPILTTTGWKSRDIANSRWEHNTEADWLNIGDEVIGYFGNAKVLAIKDLDIPEHYSTYNIEVETCHTFLADGIVVHNVKAKAAGTIGNIAGLAHSKSTLMGELGPELYVSNNHYYIAGQNGPEMVDLDPDAIVFNHIQTRQLLKNGHTPTHGRAVTNEYEASGMAHAYTKEQLEVRNKKREEDTAEYRKREAEKREAEAKAKQAKAEEKAAIIAANNAKKAAAATELSNKRKTIETMKSANAGAKALAQLTELKKQAANNLNLTDAERNELIAKIKQLETDKKNDIELYRTLKQTYDPKAIEEAEKELAKASKGQSDAANKMNNAAGNMNNAADNIDNSAGNLNEVTQNTRNAWGSQEAPRGGLTSPDNLVHPNAAPKLVDVFANTGGGAGGGFSSSSPAYLQENVRGTGNPLNTKIDYGLSRYYSSHGGNARGGGGSSEDAAKALKEAKSAVSTFLTDLLSLGIEAIDLSKYEKMPEEIKAGIQSRIDRNDSYTSFVDAYASALDKSMSEINETYFQAWQRDLEAVGLAEDQMEALESVSMYANGEIGASAQEWVTLLGDKAYVGAARDAGVLEWNQDLRQYLVKDQQALEQFMNTRLGNIWNFPDVAIDQAQSVTDEINELLTKAISDEGISAKDKRRLEALLKKQGYTNPLEYVKTSDNKFLMTSKSAEEVAANVGKSTNDKVVDTSEEVAKDMLQNIISGVENSNISKEMGNNISNWLSQKGESLNGLTETDTGWTIGFEAIPEAINKFGAEYKPQILEAVKSLDTSKLNKDQINSLITSISSLGDDDEVKAIIANLRDNIYGTAKNALSIVAEGFGEGMDKVISFSKKAEMEKAFSDLGVDISDIKFDEVEGGVKASWETIEEIYKRTLTAAPEAAVDFLTKISDEFLTEEQKQGKAAMLAAAGKVKESAKVLDEIVNARAQAIASLAKSIGKEGLNNTEKNEFITKWKQAYNIDIDDKQFIQKGNNWFLPFDYVMKLYNSIKAKSAADAKDFLEKLPEYIDLENLTSEEIEAYRKVIIAAQESGTITVSEMNKTLAPLYDAIRERVTKSVDFIKNLVEGTSSYEDLQSLKENLQALDLGLSEDEINEKLQFEETENGLQITDVSFDWLIEVLSKDYPKRVEELIKSANETYFKNWEDNMNKASKDAMKQMKYYSGGEMSGSSSDWNNLLSGQMKVSDLVALGVLTYNEKLDTYVARSVDEIKKLGLDPDIFDEDAIKDGIRKTFDDIVSNFTKAINEGLTNIEVAQFKETLHQQGINVDLTFRQTVDGLKLSEASAWKLYAALKEVDEIAARLVFKDINESLKKTNDNYRNIESISKRIVELKEKIASLEAKKDTTKIDQYKEELELAKKILEVRTTEEDDAMNFMDQELPGALKNPINYANSITKAMKAFKEAVSPEDKNAQAGFMDYKDLYNMVSWMNSLASEAAPINFAGKQLTGSIESFENVMVAAAGALKVTDSGELKVSLTDMGMDLRTGFEDAATNTNVGLKAFAESQIKVIDGLINFFETIVAMESLGDVDIDQNGMLDLTEIFMDPDKGLYTAEVAQWANDIIAMTESNEKLKTALSDFKINGIALIDIIKGARDGVNETGINVQALMKAYNALYQLSLSNDYDLDHIAESLQNALAGMDVDGLVLQYGDQEIMMLKGKAIIHTQKDGQDQYVYDGVTYNSVAEVFNAYNSKVLADLQENVSWAKSNSEEGSITIDLDFLGSYTLTIDQESGHISDGSNLYANIDEFWAAKSQEYNKATGENLTTLEFRIKMSVVPEVSSADNLTQDQIALLKAAGIDTGEELKSAWESSGEDHHDFIIKYGFSLAPEEGENFFDKSGMDKLNELLADETKTVNVKLILSSESNTEALDLLKSDEAIDVNASLGINTETANAKVEEFRTEVANKPAEIKVQSDTSLAQQTAEETRTYIDNLSATIDVNASVDSAISDLQRVIDKIADIDTSIDIDVNVNQNGEIGDSSATGNVSGSAMAAGTETLMGELGPELYVSNGRYHLAGQNGAEFVKLPDDAIVFNHIQTKRLLETGSAGRGKPITNEYAAVAMARGTQGPAMASAKAALATLKQLRAMWESLANTTVQQFAGVGGSDKSNMGAPWLAQVERWYDLLQKIARLEKEITYQETLRNKLQSDRIPNGKEYYKTQMQSLNNLKQQAESQKELAESQEAYFEQRRKELNERKAPFAKFYTFDEGGQLKYNDGAYARLADIVKTDETGKPKYTPEQQYNIMRQYGFEEYMKYDSSGKLIERDENNPDDFFSQSVQAVWERMEAEREEMQSLYDSKEEAKLSYLSAITEANKLLQELIDNQRTIEDKVLQAIEDREQAIIDKLTDEREALSNASEKYIKGLEDTLSKERQLYEKNNETKELETLQRRLSILQRSGGPQSEIASLQQEIQEKSQDMYFDTQQEQIDSVREASDLQLEKLQTQIDLMTESLEYSKAHGLLWAEVSEVLQGTSEEIVSFITGNMKDWNSKSTLGQEEEHKDLLFIAQKFESYRNEEHSDLLNLQQALEEGFESILDAVEASIPSDTINQAIADNEVYAGSSISTSGSGSFGSSASKSSSSNTNASTDSTNIRSYKMTDKEKKELARQFEYRKWLMDKNIEVSSWLEKYGPTADPKNVQEYQGYLKAQNEELTKVEAKIQQLIDRDPNYKYEYAHGGMVDYTGLAKVHGTKSRPEAFMNADEVQMWKQEILGNSSHSLLGQMLEIRSLYDSISGVSDSITHNTDSIIIEHAEVNMNVEQLANDYDARRAGEVALEEMVRIARKQGMNNVRR